MENDDGLPHTLEHLVFLGSEDFPFKVVLYIFINRLLHLVATSTLDYVVL